VTKSYRTYRALLQFPGGADGRIYIPSIWLDESDNLLALLVESVSLNSQATINELVISRATPE
jgi:hypothetical protein